MLFFFEHDCGRDEKGWIEKGFAGLGLIAGLGVVVERGGRKGGGRGCVSSEHDCGIEGKRCVGIRIASLGLGARLRLLMIERVERRGRECPFLEYTYGMDGNRCIENGAGSPGSGAGYGAA